MIKRVKNYGSEALLASNEFREYVEKFESEINRGISTLCILTIIDRYKETGIHGYKILKDLEEITKEMLVIEEGTLYPLLRKLESRGFIESKKSEVDGRIRKVYQMSLLGNKMYNHLIGFFTRLIEAISPLMDVNVNLQEKYLYCPNCANKIDLDDEEINYCEICGLNIQDIKEKRSEK